MEIQDYEVKNPLVHVFFCSIFSLSCSMFELIICEVLDLFDARHRSFFLSFLSFFCLSLLMVQQLSAIYMATGRGATAGAAYPGGAFLLVLPPCVGFRCVLCEWRAFVWLTRVPQAGYGHVRCQSALPSR
jgi:hypothetical protein